MPDSDSPHDNILGAADSMEDQRFKPGRTVHLPYMTSKLDIIPPSSCSRLWQCMT